MSKEKFNTKKTQVTNPKAAPEAQESATPVTSGPEKAAGLLEARCTAAPKGQARTDAGVRKEPEEHAAEEPTAGEARPVAPAEGGAETHPEEAAEAAPSTAPETSAQSPTPPAPAGTGNATPAEKPSAMSAEPAASAGIPESDSTGKAPAEAPAQQAPSTQAAQPETASTAAPAESDETSKAPGVSRPAERPKESPEGPEPLPAGAPTPEEANAGHEAPGIEHSPEAPVEAPGPQDPNAQAAQVETAAPAAPGEKPATASQAATPGNAARIESQTAEASDTGLPSVSSSNAPVMAKTSPRGTPRAETKAQAPESVPADEAKNPAAVSGKDEPRAQASGTPGRGQISVTGHDPITGALKGPAAKPAQRVDIGNLIKEKNSEKQGQSPEKTENAEGETQTAPESSPDKSPRAPARGESRAPKSGEEATVPGAPPAASEAKGTPAGSPGNAAETAPEKAASDQAGNEAPAGDTKRAAQDQAETETPGEEATDQSETEARTETGSLFSEPPQKASAADSDPHAPAPAGVTALRTQPLLTRGQRLGAGAMAAVALAVGLAIFGATRHGTEPEAGPKADSVITSPKTLTLPPVPPVPALLPEKALEKPRSPAAASPEPETTPEPKPDPRPLVPDIREAATASGGSAAPAVPAAPVERKPTEAEERYGAPLALTNTATKEGKTGREPAAESSRAGRTAAPGVKLGAADTDTVRARAIGGRSLLLPKGTVIECVLETRIDTTVPGMTTCVIPRDVWSADGRVLLLEKGARATGEYRGAVQKGLARVFLLWNRIVTPRGVAIDLDSPAADPLGGAGIPGSVDHHWWARFGNALLFSLVQDAFDFGVARETKAAGGVNYYSSTTDSMDEIVKEAMRQAGDIPPTLTKPQGSRISLVASRDLDFSDVYRVEAAEAALPARLPARPEAYEPEPQGGAR